MSGFTLSNNQNDADYTGKLQTYGVADTHATLLAPGDVVVITGTSNAEGVGEVDAAAAGAAITGVVSSFKPLFTNENLTETGLPALTEGEARVHIDPNLMFEADASATLLAADVGLNIDILATAATKSGGLTLSNMELDSTTKAATQTLQFRIVALLEDEAGILGNRALVRFNNTTLSDGAAGV